MRAIQRFPAPNMKSEEPNPKAPLLGRVLVTGGCGFLGYHLVGLLLADPACGAVYVLDPSISSTTNVHAGASYIAGSITSATFLAQLLDDIQPTVIFHTASPSASYAPSRAVFHTTNVVGTRTLLAAATAHPAVQALVYTSSIDIYAHNGPLRRADEEHPLWPCTLTSPPFLAAALYGLSEYDRTKTLAHKLVLAANNPRPEDHHHNHSKNRSLNHHRSFLLTSAIVPAHIWGVRDRQGLSLFFDSFADPSKPLWRIGSGANVNSVVEAGNCAAAHVLAAKALMGGGMAPGLGGCAAGQAFNVTDGADVNFWDDVMLTTAMIRGSYDGKTNGHMARVYVIPAWLMRVVVWIVKWALLIFTFGSVEPSQPLSTNGCSWATEDHTLDDKKARQILGYRPRKIDREELLVRAVKFEKERRRALAEKKLD